MLSFVVQTYLKGKESLIILCSNVKHNMDVNFTFTKPLPCLYTLFGVGCSMMMMGGAGGGL
jgi:hypothetical protein